MALPETLPPGSCSLFSKPRLSVFAVIILLFSFFYRPAIQLYAFRSVDHTASLTRYADSSPLNSERCVVNYAADACEDVNIHFASSTAFLTCGNPEERVYWYPPSCAHNAAARSEESFREYLVKYDIKTKKTTNLRLEGLSGDFITHGIDVYSLPDDLTKIHIFAVNHGRGGDSIIIFSHVLGSDSLQVVRDARHPGIKTANGVTAVGPLDFFITNDHYFTGGILRKIEDYFAPWPWATDVQYCDARTDATVCRRVSERRPGFNGIALSEDKTTLFVSDSKIGVLTIFSVTEEKSLIQTHSIPLGAAADNIRLLPMHGDAIVSIFPTLEDLPYYKANVRSLGREVLVPSAALRLRKDNGYTPELVYKSDGSGVSYMTVAAVDPDNRVLIAGLVLQYGGFAVCDLAEGAIG